MGDEARTIVTELIEKGVGPLASWAGGAMVVYD